MNDDLHPTLARLDDLAQELSADPALVAVLGLGSAGQEHDRFDDHSDIDFFVVLDSPDAKGRYLRDVTWLDGFGGRVAFSFVNDPNGRKALFDDGLFVEYAVFTPDELVGVPMSGERVAWQRGGPSSDALAFLEHRAEPPSPTSIDTVDFHLHEALTNLYVGLHRELRGEHLTAMRFIQVYAVDRVLALVRHEGGPTWDHRDPFDSTRRVETSVPADRLPLRDLLPGYAGNAAAAAAVLAWLTTHHDPDPALVRAVEDLLADKDSSAI